jgi:hypothetical protein
VESFGHAIALPHGMLAILMNLAWSIKEILIVIIKIALSVWLLYGVDEIVWSTGDVAVQPLIPSVDHHDGVHSRHSACRALHGTVLHSDHHRDVGGDQNRRHKQCCPCIADQLL